MVNPTNWKERKLPDARKGTYGERAFKRRRPYLAAELEKIEVGEVTQAILLVQRTRRQLSLAQQLYNQCIKETHDYQRRSNLLRRKALKTAAKLRKVIFDVRRQLSAKDAMLARLEHEAKIGRLLDSSKSLESLAKAYLSPEEWGLIQRRRKWHAQQGLKRKLKAAVTTDNGTSETQV